MKNINYYEKFGKKYENYEKVLKIWKNKIKIRVEKYEK